MAAACEANETARAAAERMAREAAAREDMARREARELADACTQTEPVVVQECFDEPCVMCKGSGEVDLDGSVCSFCSGSGINP